MSELKSIWLGQVNVGKTSLLMTGCQPALNQKKFPPTMGIDAIFFLDRGNPENRMMCWDTSGHERFESVVTMFFKQCQIAVLVYDVNNPSSFETAIRWHKRLLKGMKVYMVGNKMDLENKIEPESVEKYCTEHQIEHFKFESTDIAAVQAFMTYMIEYSGVQAFQITTSTDVTQDCCTVA